MKDPGTSKERPEPSNLMVKILIFSTLLPWTSRAKVCGSSHPIGTSQLISEYPETLNKLVSDISVITMPSTEAMRTVSWNVDGWAAMLPLASFRPATR